MAWALVNHTIQAGAGAASTQTTAINLSACTGTGLIVVAVSDYNANALGTLTDSSGNTWNVNISHNDVSSNIRTTLFYLFNPSVSASQTFTYTASAAAFAAVGVIAFTGALNGTVDTQNAADSGASAVSTLALGSITPSVNNEMLFAALSAGSAGFTGGTMTINNGTMPDTPVNYNGSNSFGLAFAYFDQVTAAAINETFSWTTAMFASGIVGSFEPAAATAAALYGWDVVNPHLLTRFAAVGGSPT